MDKLSRRDIAPRARYVSLILRLIVDDRLPPGRAPFRGALNVPILNADVIDPRLAVIEIHRCLAIMYRLDVPIGVVLFDYVEISIPLRDGLTIQQEIVFVRQRPPDVRKSREPGDEIADVAEIAFGPHVAIAPAIVWMKNDDIGLDAHFPKCCDLRFEMLEHPRVRSVEVLLAGGGQFKRAIERLVFVIDVILREGRHSEFVEVCALQRRERLRLHFERLMGPGVAGRSERKIGRAVRVREMEFVANGDGSMHLRPRHGARKGARPSIQFSDIRERPIDPFPRSVRHETHAIDSIAIIETGNLDPAIAESENGVERDVEIRIAGRRALERSFEGVPLRLSIRLSFDPLCPGALMERIGYSLTAPDVSPLTKYRWKMR